MGVENPTVIDFVGHNSRTDQVTLAMVEERVWDGSEERLLQLQTKINNYLSFVLDGQFAQLYPDLRDKSLIFQLDCSFAPDANTYSFLNQVRNALTNHKIGWAVKVFSANDQTLQREGS